MKAFKGSGFESRRSRSVFKTLGKLFLFLLLFLFGCAKQLLLPARPQDAACCNDNLELQLPRSPFLIAGLAYLNRKKGRKGDDKEAGRSLWASVSVGQAWVSRHIPRVELDSGYQQGRGSALPRLAGRHSKYTPRSPSPESRGDLVKKKKKKNSRHFRMPFRWMWEEAQKSAFLGLTAFFVHDFGAKQRVGVVTFCLPIRKGSKRLVP